MQYLGIAADEPERIERHTRPGIILPLVDILMVIKPLYNYKASE